MLPTMAIKDSPSEAVAKPTFICFLEYIVSVSLHTSKMVMNEDMTIEIDIDAGAFMRHTLGL